MWEQEGKEEASLGQHIKFEASIVHMRPRLSKYNRENIVYV